MLIRSPYQKSDGELGVVLSVECLNSDIKSSANSTLGPINSILSTNPNSHQKSSILLQFTCLGITKVSG